MNVTERSTNHWVFFLSVGDRQPKCICSKKSKLKSTWQIILEKTFNCDWKQDCHRLSHIFSISQCVEYVSNPIYVLKNGECNKPQLTGTRVCTPHRLASSVTLCYRITSLVSFDFLSQFYKLYIFIVGFLCVITVKNDIMVHVFLLMLCSTLFKVTQICLFQK